MKEDNKEDTRLDLRDEADDERKARDVLSVTLLVDFQADRNSHEEAGDSRGSSAPFDHLGE